MEALDRFGGLLEILESSQESLHIGHMGLSMPTLVRAHLHLALRTPGLWTFRKG